MKTLERAVLSQADGIALAVMYSTKYATEEQLRYGAYFEYTERSVANRLRKLERSGYIRSFRITLPPHVHDVIDPFRLVLVGGGAGGRVSLKPPGATGDRDQITKVYFLDSLGESWVRDLIPHYRPAFHLPKPFTRENWSHELSVTSLYVAMLHGEIPDRLDQCTHWRWHTPYRGTSFKISVTNRSQLTKVTPDAVIQFEGRGRTILLEMDKGTKGLLADRWGRNYNKCIDGTLTAYDTFFRDAAFDSNFLPQLVYVTPSLKRAKGIGCLLEAHSAIRLYENALPQALAIPDAARFLWEWAYRSPYKPPAPVTKSPEERRRETLLFLVQELNNRGLSLSSVTAELELLER